MTEILHLALPGVAFRCEKCNALFCVSWAFGRGEIQTGQCLLGGSIAVASRVDLSELGWHFRIPDSP